MIYPTKLVSEIKIGNLFWKYIIILEPKNKETASLSTSENSKGNAEKSYLYIKKKEKKKSFCYCFYKTEN